eukprot:gnl/MRDRNA2_/MRDRNA2_76224_c0_seq1.p1 gnl/MRDRNA2_/MRDRNA2_76224_c0~~gnl/MRDRNA2_/MRDRNA2_76224_c0_seq1.p1  ORF type:complete len:377 (+),score=47.75 gnl/MRDRNA2_/MRDRNA2_76224_c0_seq1:96-1226(+)
MTAGKSHGVDDRSGSYARNSEDTPSNAVQSTLPDAHGNAVVLRFARRWRANAAANANRTLASENHPLRNDKEARIKDIVKDGQRRYISITKQVNYNSQDSGPDVVTLPSTPKLKSTDGTSSPSSPKSPRSPKLPSMPQAWRRRHSTCSTSGKGIYVGDQFSFEYVDASHRRHSELSKKSARQYASEPPMGPQQYESDETHNSSELSSRSAAAGVGASISARGLDSVQLRTGTPLGLDATPLSPVSPESPRSPLLPKGSSSRPRRQSSGAQVVTKTFDTIREDPASSLGMEPCAARRSHPGQSSKNESLRPVIPESSENYSTPIATLPTTGQTVSSKGKAFLVRQAKIAEEFDEWPVDECNEARMRQQTLADRLLCR